MLITYESTLLHKKLLSGHVTQFSFSHPIQLDWNFLAGQYMIFHIPQSTGLPARRLYSIASPPTQKTTLDFIIEIVPGGVAGQFLSHLEIGQPLTLQGPAGLFTFKDSPAAAIFIATGTGIAPMYSMIHDQLAVRANTQPLHLLWGMKTNQDIYLFEELQNLSRLYPNFTFQCCLSRDDITSSTFPDKYASNAFSGRVTLALEQLLIQRPVFANPTTDYYLCGGKLVIDGLKQYFTQTAIPPQNIHLEKFT